MTKSIEIYMKGLLKPMYCSLSELMVRGIEDMSAFCFIQRSKKRKRETVYEHL
jgi:hypothetical protein